MLEGERAHKAAEMIKALGHPLRLQIVTILCQGEEHVNKMASLLGVKPAIVSQQLRILRMNRLVEATRNRGRVYYRLAEPQLHNFIQCIERCALD
jgi:DNA-binding transcriptional ArsR family regulator